VSKLDLVLVDTGIWSAFFSKPASAAKRALDLLLDEDRVSLTGPVLAEVLRGFRRADQADWAASRLRLAHYVEPSWEDWRSAAALGRELAAKGHDVPLTDLVIAALARRVQAFVFTSGPHFDLIRGLKRHRGPTIPVDGQPGLGGAGNKTGVPGTARSTTGRCLHEQSLWD
jgi:predicted nucleic acid-binding protein